MAPGKDKYSDPELRDRIKKKITKSDKGGAPGQWSARKAQLMAQEYKKAGGGYRTGPDASQKNLKKWTDEEWTTADGKKAQRSGGTARYLPKKAWDKLSASEKKATNVKKQAGARSGKQFVGNTPEAEKAGAKVRRSSASKKKKSGGASKKKVTKKTSAKKASKKTAKKTGTKTKKKTARRKTSAKKRTASTGRTKKTSKKK